MEPDFVPPPPPLPAAPPAKAPNETTAWTLVALPLAGVILGFLADQVSKSAGNSVNIGILVATFFVMRQDKQQLIAAGYAAPPSLWWFLVPPVYLWKRANILGRSKTPFWVLIGVYVLTIGTSIVLVAIAFGVIGTPTALACTAVDSDVVRLWNTIDGVKQANLVGERLTSITEVSSDDSLIDGPRRTCRAAVLTKDGGRHDVDYVISNEKGTAYVRVMAR